MDLERALILLNGKRCHVRGCVSGLSPCKHYYARLRAIGSPDTLGNGRVSKPLETKLGAGVASSQIPPSPQPTHFDLHGNWLYQRNSSHSWRCPCYKCRRQK